MPMERTRLHGLGGRNLVSQFFQPASIPDPISAWAIAGECPDPGRVGTRTGWNSGALVIAQ